MIGFSYLSAAPPLDEVNFWQLSGNVEFKALQPGEPFFFKLHSPQDIHLHGRTLQLQILTEQLPNLLEHAPRG